MSNDIELDDPVLQNAGKKAGLEIWRVENFKMKAIPSNQYGSFYEGDAYIVMFTKETKVKGGSRFSWNIQTVDTQFLPSYSTL